MSFRMSDYNEQDVTRVESKLKREGLLSMIHIDRVNFFISQAKKEADNQLHKHKKKNDGETFLPIEQVSGLPYKHDLWTQFYCEAMNRLTIDAGLRCE